MVLFFSFYPLGGARGGKHNCLSLLETGRRCAFDTSDFDEGVKLW